MITIKFACILRQSPSSHRQIKRPNKATSVSVPHRLKKRVNAC